MEYSSTRPHEIEGRRPAPPWSLNRLFIALIGVYQRRISPRKGWRCAYAVLHGGPGCSGFARETIETYGWRSAIPLVRQRFRDCHSAANEMRARRHAQGQLSPFAPDGEPPLGPGPSPSPGPGRRNRAAQGNSGSEGSNCDCFPDIPCCDAFDGLNASSCHIPSFDASSCHIGSCDLGGCDSCNGCDGCGGCDGCSCGN